MAAVGLGVEANGAWAAWAARVRAWSGRHAVLVRRLRRTWTIWSWASLAVFVTGLVVVDSARPGLRPWLWAYYGIVQLFLVARTKTVSWRFVALVFSVGIVTAPLIGLLEVVISGWIDADINAADGAVYVAGPVEESLKLVPLLAILLFARRRAQGFAVVDFLLVGYAAGFAFQAVEDTVRRIVEGQRTTTGFASLGEFLFADLPLGDASYGWGWLQGGSHVDISSVVETSEPAWFAGHAVPTALAAVGIGLALRLRWRLGPLVWLLPVALFGLVTVDHAMFNEVANRPIVELPEVRVDEELAERFDIELPGQHEADVPDSLQDAWRTWGRGRFEGPLLTLLLAAGMVLDVRRLRRARTTLPPLPAVPTATRLQRLADRAGDALALSARGTTRSRRVVVGAVAESVRWTIATLADIWHHLVLAVVGAAPDGTSGRSRLLVTLRHLRLQRQVGQQAETLADRRRPRTGLRGIWRGLAAAGVGLVVVLAGVAVVAAAVEGGGGSGGGGADGVFLANLLEELGEWWSGLSFAEQMILIGGAAFLLSFGFGWAFLPTLGYVSMASAVPEHGRGAADFVRDPNEATRRFFRDLTPADVLWYAGSEAAGRLVPRGSSFVRNRLRRNVDEIIEAGDDRVRRSVDDEVAPDVDAPPRPRTGNPREDGRWITPGQEPGVPRRSHGNPFNRDYEDWVRTEAGGPHGQEFQLDDVNFDGIDSHHFDGTPGDVLLDAKGDYSRFVDPRTGEWHEWWGNNRNPAKGLKGELADATRQVDAAAGTPVEWRCAQEDVAELLNLAFDEEPELHGRITAVFVAPPEGMAP